MDFNLPPFDDEELRKMVNAWNEHFDVIRKMVKKSKGTEEQASKVFIEAYAALRASEAAGELVEPKESFGILLYQLAARIWQEEKS